MDLAQYITLWSRDGDSYYHFSLTASPHTPVTHGVHGVVCSLFG